MVIKIARINLIDFYLTTLALTRFLQLHFLSTRSLRLIPRVSFPVCRPFKVAETVCPGLSLLRQIGLMSLIPIIILRRTKNNVCNLEKLNPRITNLVSPHDGRHGHPVGHGQHLAWVGNLGSDTEGSFFLTESRASLHNLDYFLSFYSFFFHTHTHTCPTFLPSTRTT